MPTKILSSLMQKRYPIISIVLGVCIFLSLTALGFKTEEPSKAPSRLKAEGNQLIRTDTGEALRLKGYISNYFRRGMPSVTSTDDMLKRIDKIKEMGGNAIDFYYDPWKLYLSPQEIIKNVIPIWDAVVNYAGEKGLYVIFELTGLENDVLSGKEDGILRWVAEKYKDKPYFIPGVWAEPYTTADKWAPKLKEMVKLVRDVSPDAPIVVSGANFSRDFGFLLKDSLPDPNIILSVHDYSLERISTLNQGVSFEIDNPDIKELRKTVPVMYGEFGGFWGGDFSSPEDLAIIKEQLAKIDEYGFSAMGYVLDYPDLPGLEILDDKGNLTPRGEVYKENYTAGETVQ
jgi:hypothetical protein